MQVSQEERGYMLTVKNTRVANDPIPYQGQFNSADDAMLKFMRVVELHKKCGSTITNTTDG